MSNYVGMNPEQIYGAIDNRYFYGIRRNDDGELFLVKIDQTKKGETVVIQENISTSSFQNFEEGQDFYEGRDVFHEIVYTDLKYEQFKWENRNILYYIDENGLFTLKINETHIYDNNSSSSGE